MGFAPNSAGGPQGLFDPEQDFYGRDIFFDGKLHVGAKGDYATVDGMDNLWRSLMRRFMTKPGEYRRRPGYGAGVPTYVRKKFTASVRDELTKRVTAQALQDRRVDKVLSCSITRQDVGTSPVITISLVIQVAGRRVALRPFTVSSQV